MPRMGRRAKPLVEVGVNTARNGGLGKPTMFCSSDGIGVNFCKAARLEPPILFKLQDFQASEPLLLFATCNANYEAVFCGVPNNK